MISVDPDMKKPKYVVITPVRDEADYIEKTIHSMAQQTTLPEKWVIVNDGSTDHTPEIVDNAARRYPWICVVHRNNRGFRKSGGGVIEAFYDGYNKIDTLLWDFIVKLDGDLTFDADFFERCFTYFEIEPDLGIGGGTVCVFNNGRLKVDSIGDPPFHVRGATKIYRRSCLMQISPLVKAPGWDTIDEVKANMLNWTTRTFDDVILVQHKPTGSADGNWKNWFKNGQANYITGYHPVFMFAKCIKRAFQRPLLIASAALWAGFCAGYMKGFKPAIDDTVLHYIRIQQIKRLLMQHSIYG